MNPLDSLFGEDADVLSDRGFQVLVLTNIFPAIGTALLSPILNSLIGPFGTTEARIGLLISVFTAPAIIIIPVAGVLADRYGRKPILVASLVLFGVAGSAIAFTTNFRVALGLRLLQGVAFAGLTPVIITSVGDIYDGNREATAQGIRFTGSGVAQSVFPFAAGLLVVVGWQYPFLLYALALPTAALVVVWFEEPTSEQSDDSGGTRLRELGGLLVRPQVLALVAGRALPLFVWYGLVTYNSLVVEKMLGGTPSQAGLVTAVASGMFALGASQTGRATAIFESQLTPLAIAHVLLGIGFAGFLFAPSLPLAILAIALAGTGFGLGLALYRSVVTGLADQSLRGGLVSFAEAGGRVTATVTPILMGASIAFLSPSLGQGKALQIAGLGACLVTTVGGLACLAVAWQTGYQRTPTS